MSGLNSEQLDELEDRVAELLGNPWDSGTGRPRELTLREAIIVSSGICGRISSRTSGPRSSTLRSPLFPGSSPRSRPSSRRPLAEFRPAAEQAKAAVRGQTVLVDGFLAPCWSWRGAPELWSGKHKTTGFNGQVISNLAGDIVFVSEPVTGHNHDMTALSETETAEVIAAAFSGIGDKGYQGSGYITPIKKPKYRELLEWENKFNADVSRLRAPIERAIAHIKSWRILHADYRRPLRTYLQSFRAAIGLYFFKLTYE